MTAQKSPAKTMAPAGTAQAVAEARGASQVPAIRPPRLPYHPALEERFGVDRAGWTALVDAIFPNASSPESVILALSYCRARKLDVFKRVVHIVPIYSKALSRMVDTVWPGIGEIRTTAFRTGEYAGRGATVFGPDRTENLGGVEVTFPEWAEVCVRRMLNGTVCEFFGPRVYWLETYSTAKRDTDAPNEMWANRPRGQLDKCAEAAALRVGFPEEIGSDYIADEIHDRARVVDAAPAPAVPVAAAADLDALAARLLPEEPAVEAASPAPAGDPLEGVAEAFLAAESLDAARRMYDNLCGPEAEVDLNDDQRALATGWYESAVLRIGGAGKKR